MSITVDLLEYDGTVVATDVPDHVVRGWVDIRQGAGGGEWDEALDSTSGLAHWRLLRWNLDGVPRFLSVLTEDPFVRVAEDASALLRAWAGPGALALPGRDGVPGAVVQGYGNSGLRVFGWPEPNWADGSWTPSVAMGTQGSPPGSLPGLVDKPERWPDPEAYRIWFEAMKDPHPSSSNGGAGMDEGSAWHRRRFSANTTVPARVFFTLDGQGTVYWNGEHIITTPSSRGSTNQGKTFSFDVELESGIDDVLAARVDNGSWTRAPSVNTGYILYTIVRIDSEALGEVIYRSEPGQGVWTSVEPSGVTAGYVWTRLLPEAQARGCLPGMTTDVTDTMASPGPGAAPAQPWDVSLEVAAYNDQDKYMDVLRKMWQQFKVDTRMSPGLTVQMRSNVGRDLTATVFLEDGTSVDDAVATASVDSRAPGANALRVETAEGFVWYAPAARVAADGHRREDGASFGTAATAAELTANLNQLLDDLRGVKTQVIVSSGPAGARPYVDFLVGDYVSVREDSILDAGARVWFPYRVESIAVDEDEAGNVTFEIDLERRL